jgi:hypothetical protein
MYLTARQERMAVMEQIGEDGLVKLELSCRGSRRREANHSQVAERARGEQPAPEVSTIVNTEARRDAYMWSLAPVSRSSGGAAILDALGALGLVVFGRSMRCES